MSDLISRTKAIDIGRRATVDTNPSHFDAHQKFIQFMDDVEISSFGRWQWANGFNTALTAISIDLKQLPSAEKAQLSVEGTTFDIPSAEPKTPSTGSITCVKSEKMHVRTTDDCISRQDAIDAVNAYLGLSAVSRTIQNMTSIQGILENLPSAEPDLIKANASNASNVLKPLDNTSVRWIPCSERLPEHGGYFIATSIINEDAVRVGTQWYSLKDGWASKEQTLAWMPLPEPYKGEQE